MARSEATVASPSGRRMIDADRIPWCTDRTETVPRAVTVI
jgi:hypothetical protein